jgi:branched-chain amino acid transport system ATP-binding protein
MFELRDITAGYGDGAKVLENLNLTVPDGSVVALLGANGSGKTTTLRVASRFLDITSGTIHLDGRDVTKVKPDRLAKAGVCHVPEGRGIFPSLTVEDNLRVFAPNRRDTAVARAAEAFPPLADLRTRTAGTLSGGQQQMVALARAYICGARVVLLDEVSMGLAPLVVQEIFRFIPRLCAQGTSLLIVEQYVSQALALADFAYVLSQGSVVFEGKPDELRNSSELVKAYLGEMDNDDEDRNGASLPTIDEVKP